MNQPKDSAETVRAHYRAMGAIELLNDMSDYAKTRHQQLMDSGMTDYNRGRIDELTAMVDEMTRQLKLLAPKCRYCQDNPCRCEEIDAQRKYGRPEEWN